MTVTVADSQEQSREEEVFTPFAALAQGLVQLGVERAFGLMGEDTIRLVTALKALGVSYADARHENAAVAMATGYAGATGRLGVCVISRGPGTTNGLTGAVNASRGDAAVLIITGDEWVDAPRNTSKLPDGKGLDVASLAASCDIPVFTPRVAAAFRDTLSDAVTCALTGRTVLLTLPNDLLEMPVNGLAPLRVTAATYHAAGATSTAVVAAASILAGSRRPLIVAGWGAWVSGARDALVELAEKTGGTLATTLRGKDMFAGHPYELGILGSFSHSAGRRVMEQADSVIVFGASLNRYTTNSGTNLPAVPLVHVDANRSHIGRFHPAELSVVGDARIVAEQLLEALPDRDEADKPWHTTETRQLLQDFDPHHDFVPETSSRTMDPRSLILELDALLPRDRAIVTDNGNFFGFVPSHISVPTPDRFRLSSDFAVIGLGLGTGMGAAIARPGVPTTVFIGDGALLMSIGELETLARLDLPMLIVVMNDSSYGAEQHFLELRGLPGRVAQFPDSDFAAIAEAFSVGAATARSLDELRALQPTIADLDGPFLIDCKVSSAVAAPFLSEQMPTH